MSGNESPVSRKKPRLETIDERLVTQPTGSPITAVQVATIVRKEEDLEEVKNKIVDVEAEIKRVEKEIKLIEPDIKKIDKQIEDVPVNSVMENSLLQYWIDIGKQLREKENKLLDDKNQLHEKEKDLRDEKKQLKDELKQLEDELKLLLKPQESEPQEELVGFRKIAQSMDAPSRFATRKNWPSVPHLYHHRPPGPPAGMLHVSLFSKALDKFRSKCENFVKERKPQDACDFAEKLCDSMSKVYELEAARQQRFNTLFNNFLDGTDFLHGTGFTCSPAGNNLNSDGSILVDTPSNTLKLMLLNLEVKNENGLTDCDCVMQNLSYFVKHWAAQKVERPHPPMRSFLLSLEDCVLYVHGATVVNDEVQSDELCPPLTLLLQEEIPRNMDRIAVWADALRHGLKELRDEMLVDQPPDPNFPYLVELDGLKFKYEKALKRRVFRATLVDSKEPVVVKFSTLGNAVDLHNLLAEKKFAPRLLKHAFIQSTWHVSVMEYTPDKRENNSFTKEQKDQLKEALKLIQYHGWVHGDLRDSNILCVGETQRIHIIDFEFAGKEEDEAVYPSFLSTSAKGVWRPRGVASGVLMEKEHDAKMVQRICGEDFL